MGDHALFSITISTLVNPELLMVSAAYIAATKNEIVIEKSAWSPIIVDFPI